MNYYEELGIESDASSGEVRHAYRALARMLHPDGQTDPKLRMLAECQMKRLGEVLEVLSSPRKRALYDRQLANGRLSATEGCPPPPPARLLRPPTQARWIQLASRNWFWILLGGAVLAMSSLYFTTSDSPSADWGHDVAPAVAAAPTPIAAALTPKSRATARDSVTSSESERRPELQAETAKIAPDDPIAPVPQEASGEVETVNSQTPAALPSDGKPETGPPPVAKESSPFGGNWLYLPPEKEVAPAGQYRASYVELVLREEGGVLRGHYRSRHTIPDKAISPEVLLQVYGESGRGNAATLNWATADNAKGQMELTVRAPNLLNVRWWTTEFGRGNALSSGTAVLIRQVAP